MFVWIPSNALVKTNSNPKMSESASSIASISSLLISDFNILSIKIQKLYNI